MCKPRIVLSRCFLQPVRYDGRIVINDFVDKLKKFAEFIDICPESDIGLGVPRPRIIILKDNDSKRLIQPDTGKDLTETMRQYVKETLENLKEIDGFLLKSKSPSCGVGSTKLYFKESVIGKTDGFFAEASKIYFKELPIEDEKRLKDKDIRFHFLSRIFAFADLRQLGKNSSPSSLVNFHSSYKYLLMTYNQKILKELGRIVSEGKLDINKKIDKYKTLFYQALKRKPSKARHINTLMHIFGHISDKLNKREKNHILDLMEKYRNNLVELREIVEIIRNLSCRFENSYIMSQKYLNPFPEELYV